MRRARGIRDLDAAERALIVAAPPPAAAQRRDRRCGAAGHAQLKLEIIVARDAGGAELRDRIARLPRRSGLPICASSGGADGSEAAWANRERDPARRKSKTPARAWRAQIMPTVGIASSAYFFGASGAGVGTGVVRGRGRPRPSAPARGGRRRSARPSPPVAAGSTRGGRRSGSGRCGGRHGGQSTARGGPRRCLCSLDAAQIEGERQHEEHEPRRKMVDLLSTLVVSAPKAASAAPPPKAGAHAGVLRLLHQDDAERGRAKRGSGQR